VRITIKRNNVLRAVLSRVPLRSTAQTIATTDLKQAKEIMCYAVLLISSPERQKEKQFIFTIHHDHATRLLTFAATR